MQIFQCFFIYLFYFYFSVMNPVTVLKAYSYLCPICGASALISSRTPQKHKGIIIVLTNTPQLGTFPPRPTHIQPSMFHHFSFITSQVMLLFKQTNSCSNHSFFKILTFFNFKNGGRNISDNGKAKTSIPLDFHQNTKEQSEWQSSEYLCVYCHSLFKANICPKHRSLAAESCARISASLKSFISPVWK